ncbi:MAG: hypothetical protein A49_22370 [Methyloceanibacter sp.]|nr:MAG: hypothetical protein A49_22370 [Methyloceanibacter sp.]
MTNYAASEKTQARRINVDLKPKDVHELDRLRAMTSLTTAELFRHAFNLLRLYVQARREGKDLCIIDPNGKDRLIELPFIVEREKD